MQTLRIATRSSPLALWQARFVAEQIEAALGRSCELLPMSTSGDRWLAGSLASQGGKGLFVKELETALLSGQADLAVHSLKDVPMELPAGLGLACYLARHEPADALVGARDLGELADGAVIGTASQRRTMLLKQARPDLEIRLLRGNVNTRLAKLDAGDYDAIVLAASGLQRLGMADRIGGLLDTDWMIPAPGQGILAIETRAADVELNTALAGLGCAQAQSAAEAERALSRALGGSCSLPLAGYCRTTKQGWRMRAALGMPDGSQVVHAQLTADDGDAAALGLAAAEALRDDGGDAVLAALAT